MNKYSDLARPSSSCFQLWPPEFKKHRSHASLPHINFLDSTKSTFFRKVEPATGNFFKYPSVSTLTKLENRKFETRTQPLHRLSKKESGERPKVSLPKATDFNRLLEQLDSVISTKPPAPKQFMLLEEVNNELVLAPGEKQFFKVESKGKRSPLQVSMLRICGKVTVYVSTKVKEPTEADQVFKKDQFKVAALRPTFGSEYVYFTVVALASAKLAVSLKFGANPPEEDSTEELPAEIYSPFEKYSEKHLPPDKDFVRQNKKLRAVQSDKRPNKGALWEKRRNEVIRRRSLVLFEKREKTLNFLNKQTIRQEREFKEKAERDAQEAEVRRVKLWTSLVYFTAVLSETRKTIQAKRVEVLATIRVQLSARRIQSFWKRYSQGQTHMVRTKCFLQTFYFSNCGNQSKSIVNVIQVSATNRVLPTAFQAYFRQVKFLQSSWRASLEKSKTQLSSLIPIWEQLIGDKTKKSRKFRRRQQRYSLLVSPAERDCILKKFLVERWKGQQKAKTDCSLKELVRQVLSRSKKKSSVNGHVA